MTDSRSRARKGATRVRRSRSATESLLSIVLVLESVVMFFVTLTAFGLKVLPAGVAFGGGLGLLALFVIVSGLARHPAAIAVGWVLQAVLILLGLLLPVMYIVGVVFLALWTYCFVTGRRLDRRNARFIAETTTDQEQSQS